MAKILTEAELAPHGRDTDGKPLAPLGYLVNGRPRRSNRGARAGGNKPKASPGTRTQTDVQRKEMLIMLTEMTLVNTLVAASVAPFIHNVIGNRQAEALAGDAVIISHFAPALADGLIVLSQTKPGALSWLDSVEEKAPYLLLAQVGINVAKAFVGNHVSPDARLNAAGRTLMQIRAAQMAARIEQEAADMGMRTEWVPDAENAA